MKSWSKIIPVISIIFFTNIIYAVPPADTSSYILHKAPWSQGSEGIVTVDIDDQLSDYWTQAIFLETSEVLETSDGDMNRGLKDLSSHNNFTVGQGSENYTTNLVIQVPALQSFSDINWDDPQAHIINVPMTITSKGSVTFQAKEAEMVNNPANSSDNRSYIFLKLQSPLQGSGDLTFEGPSRNGWLYVTIDPVANVSNSSYTGNFIARNCSLVFNSDRSVPGANIQLDNVDFKLYLNPESNTLTNNIHLIRGAELTNTQDTPLTLSGRLSGAGELYLSNFYTSDLTMYDRDYILSGDNSNFWGSIASESKIYFQSNTTNISKETNISDATVNTGATLRVVGEDVRIEIDALNIESGAHLILDQILAPIDEQNPDEAEYSIYNGASFSIQNLILEQGSNISIKLNHSMNVHSTPLLRIDSLADSGANLKLDFAEGMSFPTADTTYNIKLFDTAEIPEPKLAVLKNAEPIAAASVAADTMQTWASKWVNSLSIPNNLQKLSASYNPSTGILSLRLAPVFNIAQQLSSKKDELLSTLNNNILEDIGASRRQLISFIDNLINDITINSFNDYIKNYLANDNNISIQKKLDSIIPAPCGFAPSAPVGSSGAYSSVGNNNGAAAVNSVKSLMMNKHLNLADKSLEKRLNAALVANTNNPHFVSNRYRQYAQADGLETLLGDFQRVDLNGLSFSSQLTYSNQKLANDAMEDGFIGSAQSSWTENIALVQVLNERFAIGAQAQFMHTKSNLNPNSSNKLGHTKDQFNAGGILGLYQGDKDIPLSASWAINIGQHNINSTRQAKHLDVDVTATSNYKQYETNGQIELGWTLPVDSMIIVKPYAGCSFNHLKHKGYDEAAVLTGTTTASDWAMRVSPQANTIWSHRVGVEFLQAVKLHDMGTGQLHARVGYGTHKAAGDYSTLVFNYKGSPTPYNIDTPNKRLNTFDVNLGFNINLSDNIIMNGGYSGSFNKYEKTHTANLSVMYQFA